MKLIMAVSKDGYIAKEDSDDMSWTGFDDKLVFRLMTMVGGKPLGAGRKTYETMPALKARTLVSLSNDPRRGCTLDAFDAQYPDAWLIGGQDVALQAIAEERVTEFFLCHSPNAIFRGVKADHRVLNWGTVVTEIRVGHTRVEVRR